MNPKIDCENAGLCIGTVENHWWFAHRMGAKEHRKRKKPMAKCDRIATSEKTMAGERNDEKRKIVFGATKLEQGMNRTILPCLYLLCDVQRSTLGCFFSFSPIVSGVACTCRCVCVLVLCFSQPALSPPWSVGKAGGKWWCWWKKFDR